MTSHMKQSGDGCVICPKRWSDHTLSEAMPSVWPRSPDSPDPRGNAAIEAIGRIQRAIHMKDREASDGTLVTAAVIVQEAREAIRDFHNAPPRSSDSVRTPDLDVLREALQQIESACTVFLTMAAKYHPDGGPAPAWLDFIRERQAEARAALHPASPPQKGS
jgi:hypothetical protein